MANPNPIPGQFVTATLSLIDRKGQSVDPTQFLPIKWSSTDDNVAKLAGPTGGVAQAFECVGVGDADLIADAPGITTNYTGSVTVEHPAGIVKGVVTVTPSAAPVAPRVVPPVTPILPLTK